MDGRIETASPGPSAEAGGLQDRALEFAATARESVSGGMGKVKEYIGKQPVRALGVAFGIGVLLGWLIKRR